MGIRKLTTVIACYSAGLASPVAVTRGHARRRMNILSVSGYGVTPGWVVPPHSLSHPHHPHLFSANYKGSIFELEPTDTIQCSESSLARGRMRTSAWGFFLDEQNCEGKDQPQPESKISQESIVPVPVDSNKAVITVLRERKR